MGGGSSVPESFDRAASTKRASLVRDQWNDYKTRFQPVEQKIIDAMGTGINTTFNEAGQQEAQKAVDTAFTTAKATAGRDQARFGINLTPQQSRAQDTVMQVEKAASMANAKNTATQWDIDRRNAVMSGGLGNASVAGRG